MGNVWLQNYDPLQNAFLSTVVAALPVVVLLASIALLKIRIHLAALLGLGIALIVALAVCRMPPRATMATAIYGAAYGLFPIGWIILNLIFLYSLTVKAGLFEVLRSGLSTIAPDPRIQVILIAFSFGAFFEGAAGFGTPVAVTAAILIQLGFKPLAASGLSLIANTAPVAFGALGTPIIALSKVTGISEIALSQMVGRQLPLFSFLVPFWVVWTMAGFRGMLGVWPAALTAGLAFAVPQFLISNFHGPWLVDIVASICSIAATTFLLRFWRPKSSWDMIPSGVREGVVRNKSQQAGCAHGDALAATVSNAPDLHQMVATSRDSRTIPPRPGGEGRGEGERTSKLTSSGEPVHSAARHRQAWIPWLLLSVLVFIWGVPAVKKSLDGISSRDFKVPGLHNIVLRAPPVAPAATPDHPAKPEEAIFRLNWLSATGTGILAAAVLAGFIMGFTPADLAKTYCQTIVRVRFSLITIAAMLSLGYLTRYSGTDATLGLALANTGKLYPFFGTLLGWLGVALTGSDTASNVLFGSLQKITAGQVGVSPTLMAAANSSGGVMGKMIDAQSIVVASTATNWYGHEGSILRYVFFHSIALAVLVGILVILQAYVPPFSGMVVP